MAKDTKDTPRRAGALRHRVGFFKRGEVTDEYGNTQTTFPDDPTFQTHAAVVSKFAGETVLASRLQGQQTVTLTVRRSSLTEQVTPDWKAQDMREGTIWNIRSGPVDPDDGGAWLEFLCQSGTAT